MFDHFHVKFINKNGETIYGLVYPMDEDDKRAAPAGCLLIQDAIFPKSYWVPEKDLVDIKDSYPDEYDKFVDSEYKKAKALSEKVDDNIVPGNLFGVGVADGTAWYVVTKVSKNGKKCDVEWRGYCMDRWTDHYFGWGRKNVPVKDIEPYAMRANSYRKIFGKREATLERLA